MGHPRRLWIPSESRKGDELRISGGALHHLRDVLRMGAGDRFEALSGDGRAHLAEIRSIGKREAVASILESREIPPPSPPYLALAVSMPRFAAFETIIEKSVELGVRRVIPFLSEFSFVRNDPAALEAKRPRWEKIVEAATEQCGRGDRIEIAPAAGLAEILREYAAAKRRAGIFSFEGEGGIPVRQALAEAKRSGPETLWLFVGSEGGFSEGEVERFRLAGLEPATLGPRILRVETACLALVALAQCELGKLEPEKRLRESFSPRK